MEELLRRGVKVEAIHILSTDLTLLGEIACVASIRLCRKFREPGEFEMVLPLAHPMADRLVRDRILCPAGEIYKAMIIECVTRDTGADTVSVTGYTLSGLLKRRICIPPVQEEDSFGYDRIIDDAESVMRHYVENNVVSPLSTARRMDCIALESENGRRGRKDVAWNARFEQLDELLASIGAYCDAGYAIVPDFEKKKLVFMYLAGRDRTGMQGFERVTFGMHMGNVCGTVETQSAQQEKNAAIVGGAGEDENRLILTVCPGGEAGLQRREMFADAGSLSDPGEITIEGTHRLSQRSAVHAICAQVVETPSCRYGVHWDLGDLVTVMTPHAQMNARIMQVQESYEAGKPVCLEVVFGDPAGGIEHVIREKTRSTVR